MTETTVKMDSKGRITIPRLIRKQTELKESCYIHIRLDGRKIIIESAESVADKYFGAFKATKWPQDLNKFMFDKMKKNTLNLK